MLINIIINVLIPQHNENIMSYLFNFTSNISTLQFYSRKCNSLYDLAETDQSE